MWSRKRVDGTIEGPLLYMLYIWHVHTSSTGTIAASSNMYQVFIYTRYGIRMLGGTFFLGPLVSVGFLARAYGCLFCGSVLHLDVLVQISLVADDAICCGAKRLLVC